MRVSLEVLREFMVFPGTLGRVSGVLERVRGDLTILLFLQPLLCDWHVLHGPKDVCVCVRQVSDSLEDADLATKERAGASSKNSKTHPGGVGGKGVSAIK